MAFSSAGLALETVLFSEGKGESASQAAHATASQTERFLKLRAVLATSSRSKQKTCPAETWQPPTCGSSLVASTAGHQRPASADSS